MTPLMTSIVPGNTTALSAEHPSRAYSSTSLTVSGNTIDSTVSFPSKVPLAATTLYVIPSYSTCDGTVTSVSSPV